MSRAISQTLGGFVYCMPFKVRKTILDCFQVDGYSFHPYKVLELACRQLDAEYLSV